MSSLPLSPGGTDRASRRTSLASTLFLTLVSVPLFFVALGGHGLSDPDEPYYAVPALEMLRGGTWLTTTLRGQPWFDKPILFYWIVLSAYRLFGVSEMAARLGSACAALAGLFAVRAVGRRIGFDERTSFAASLILATSLEYAFVARAAVTDMTLTLTLLLAMLAGASYLSSGSRLAASLFGASLGLAALTKGPVGLILPVVALGGYALLARRSEILKPGALAACAAGLLLTAGPWYGFMASRHRDLLIQTFIGEGNFGRFLHPEHPSSPFYYLLTLAAGLLPWSGALPFALVGPARPSSWRAETGAGRPAGPLYALCWFAAPILVFSLSASKLPTYILPAFPAAALLLGRYWSSRLGEPAPHAAGRLPFRPGHLAPLAVTFMVVMAGGIAVIGALRDRGVDQAVTGSLLVIALFLAGLALAAPAVRRGSLFGLLAAHAGVAVLGFLTLVLWAGPRLEPYDSIRPLVRRLESLGSDQQITGAYHVWDLSPDFYLGRTLEVITERPLLLRRVAASPGGVWIVRTRDLAALASDPDLTSATLYQGPRRCALRLAPAVPIPEPVAPKAVSAAPKPVQ